jgi:biotin carboxyl carrier protein
MKYYMINSEGNEVSFDVTGMQEMQGGIIGFSVTTQDKALKQYFIKTVAGKNYISEDKLNWRKAPEIANLKGVVNSNETLSVYRGFKPSGLSNANAGELKTDMPGKIVKVLTTEGAVVNQGDTLLILEAMKMENEIKAGVDGVVKSVFVKEGQTVEAGHLMIEIEE